MLKTLYFSMMALGMLMLIPSADVYAASGVGRIVHTYGPAWIERGDTREKIRKGRVVLRNDSIITGPRGRVKLIMGDGSKVYVGAKSRISLRKYSLRGKKLLNASINMLWGKARFFVNKLASRDASFRVQTSTAVLGVRGTEFSVWVPPTDAVLSMAFDFNITLADMPPLPTRTVLMEGAVDVDTGSGIQYRLTPGNTADVDSDRRVKVRKTNNEDLEEHAKPLVVIKGDTDTEVDHETDQPAQPKTIEPKQDADKQPDDVKPSIEDNKNSGEKNTGEKNTGEKNTGEKNTGEKNADAAEAQSPQGGGAQQPAKEDNANDGQPQTATPTPQGNGAPKAGANPQAEANALPDNPQSSDAASIMLGGDAGVLLDQPNMPPPPAVAPPPMPVNTGDLAGNANGNGQAGGEPNQNGSNQDGTNPNGATPNGPNPNAAPLNTPPQFAAVIIDTQATTNAIQNLGTATDIEIRPNFVKP